MVPEAVREAVGMKWEYQALVGYGSMVDLAERLNLCGADGWDVVTASPQGASWHCLLKRPVREQPSLSMASLAEKHTTKQPEYGMNRHDSFIWPVRFEAD